MSLGVTKVREEQEGGRRMRGDDYPFVTNYCRYNWVLNLGMSQICMTKKKAETGLWGDNLERNLYIGN